MATRKKPTATRKRASELLKTERDALAHAAECGLDDDDIAALVKVGKTRLATAEARKVIAEARADSNARVGRALLDRALRGHVEAQKFWLKAKAGWRDTEAALEREIAERARRTPRILVIE